jgi:integrase
MQKMTEKHDQNTPSNNFDLVAVPKDAPDSLRMWAAWYFKHAVTTTDRSQKEQHRDIELFLHFMERTENTDVRFRWTARLSESFKEHLRSALNQDGSRQWSDRTINRVLAHLKTFAKWIHSLHPFPLDEPMKKIKLIPITNSLEIERAITAGERRRLLDAADLLIQIGGLSKSRRRYAGKSETARPRRKGYRAYRNRAIIYTLIETGMRRRAVTVINIADVDFEKRKITVEEKGGTRHTYQISREGLGAIRDYVTHERNTDNVKWQSPMLFLSNCMNPHGNGCLNVKMINLIWNEVCKVAGVDEKSPHSARHAMGRHLIEKTNGNVAAVQRQLGHKNAAYSLQYARITDEELNVVLDDR